MAFALHSARWGRPRAPGADELGRIAVNALLTRTGIDPGLIDEVIFGCVGSTGGTRRNVARVIACVRHSRTGTGITVHRNCASGLEAVTQACENGCGRAQSSSSVNGKHVAIPLLFKQRPRTIVALSKAEEIRPKSCAPLLQFRPSDFQPRIGLQLGLLNPVLRMNMVRRRIAGTRVRHHAREQEPSLWNHIGKRARHAQTG